MAAEAIVPGLRVYKFGGASVKDAAGVRNVARVIQEVGGDGPLLIVVSAMGKTTNALEEIFDLAYHGRDYTALLERLEAAHMAVADELLGEPEADEEGGAYHPLEPWLYELREKLNAVNQELVYDYQYDQIISCGELLASQLVCGYLNQQSATIGQWGWQDARHIIRTDSTWREARVDWVGTQERVNLLNQELPYHKRRIVTQGFVGGPAPVSLDLSGPTPPTTWQVYKPTTTLGREGSDYSAAIFAYCLQAESVTIWKDVPGLLNADPKFFPDTVLYPEISYQETIEMAYYGASVIHPKTLQPLAERHIPLYVKSFVDPEAPGTVIHDCRHPALAPAFIRKGGQCLLSFESKDFAFISEENLAVIFGALAEARLKINVMQSSAISFSVATDYDEGRVRQLLATLGGQFRSHYNAGLTLFTIKHYDEASIAQLTAGRVLLLEQRTRSTFQFLVRE